MNQRKSHLSTDRTSASRQQDTSVTFRIQKKRHDIRQRQRLLVRTIKSIFHFQKRRSLKNNQNNRQQDIRIRIIETSKNSRIYFNFSFLKTSFSIEQSFFKINRFVKIFHHDNRFSK